jgi:hypothetical protein
MGLLQNISIRNAEPIDRTGDTSEYWPQCLNWQMNKYVSLARWDKKSGVPEGYSPPYSFQMPIKEGGMSSFAQIIGIGKADISSYMATVKAFPLPSGGAITGSGTISSATISRLIWLTLTQNLTGSGQVAVSSSLTAYAFFNAPSISGSGYINNSSHLTLLIRILASLSGSGQINASVLSLIVSMTANLEGDGEISDAQLILFIWLASNLGGSGYVNNSSLLKSYAKLSSALSGSGVLTNSAIKLFAWCHSSLTGNGHAAGTMKGWADMESTITSAGELVTAQSCAQAVWDFLLSNSLSAEDTLLAAGSAGDPWVGEIEPGVNAKETLRALLSIMVGKTKITKGSGTTATVKFRDVNDTRDSVVATMDGSQRNAVVLDND